MADDAAADSTLDSGRDFRLSVAEISIRRVLFAKLNSRDVLRDESSSFSFFAQR